VSQNYDLYPKLEGIDEETREKVINGIKPDYSILITAHNIE